MAPPKTICLVTLAPNIYQQQGHQTGCLSPEGGRKKVMNSWLWETDHYGKLLGLCQLMDLLIFWISESFLVLFCLQTNKKPISKFYCCYGVVYLSPRGLKGIFPTYEKAAVAFRHKGWIRFEKTLIHIGENTVHKGCTESAWRSLTHLAGAIVSSNTVLRSSHFKYLSLIGWNGRASCTRDKSQGGKSFFTSRRGWRAPFIHLQMRWGAHWIVIVNETNMTSRDSCQEGFVLHSEIQNRK